MFALTAGSLSQAACMSALCCKDFLLYRSLHISSHLNGALAMRLLNIIE